MTVRKSDGNWRIWDPELLRRVSEVFSEKLIHTWSGKKISRGDNQRERS